MVRNWDSQHGTKLGEVEAELINFGTNLGPSWALLGQVEPCWGHVGVGARWGQVGPSWALLGPIWGQVAPSWDHVGTKLGPSWDYVGRF